MTSTSLKLMLEMSFRVSATGLIFLSHFSFFCSGIRLIATISFVTSVTRCVCEENRPQCGPTHICLSKLIHNLYCGKSGPKFWAAFVIFEKTPKLNNRPSKNSPNLVTLFVTTFLPDSRRARISSTFRVN
jgi:hypothetical protein